MIQQSLVGVAGTLFTLVAIACVDKWGRKPLMFLGSAGMLLSLAAMGVMAPPTGCRRMSAAGCLSASSLIWHVTACPPGR